MLVKESKNFGRVPVKKIIWRYQKQKMSIKRARENNLSPPKKAVKVSKMLILLLLIFS